MKKCKKCNIKKLYKSYSRNKSSKDGYVSQCKECKKKYYLENKEKIDLLNKVNYSKNRDSILEKQREYYKDNKEKHNINNKEYYKDNKEKILEKQKEYYKNNKGRISLKKMEYNGENKEKIREQKKEYYKDNKEYIKNRNKEYIREKISKCHITKLKHNIRTSICNSIRKNGYIKINKTEFIIGCSFEDFKLYLESKFEDWMSCDNYGLYNGELNHGWDIDHIIPLSSTKEEEKIIELNHHTNLQPLCSYTNRCIKR